MKNIIITYIKNQEIIKLVKGMIFQKKLKHITIKYHYIKDLIQIKDIQLKNEKVWKIFVNNLTELLEYILFKIFFKFLCFIIKILVNQNQDILT